MWKLKKNERHSGRWLKDGAHENRELKQTRRRRKRERHLKI